MGEIFTREEAQKTIVYEVFKDIIFKQKPSQITFSTFKNRNEKTMTIYQDFKEEMSLWGKLNKNIEDIENNYEIMLHCKNIDIQFLFAFYKFSILRNKILGKYIAYYELNIHYKNLVHSSLTVETSKENSKVNDYEKNKYIDNLSLNGGAVLMEMLFNRNLKNIERQIKHHL